MEIEYFIAGMETEADRVVNAKTTQKMPNEYNNVLTGIWCFKGMFLVQVKKI